MFMVDMEDSRYKRKEPCISFPCQGWQSLVSVSLLGDAGNGIRERPKPLLLLTNGLLPRQRLFSFSRNPNFAVASLTKCVYKVLRTMRHSRVSGCRVGSAKWLRPLRTFSFTVKIQPRESEKVQSVFSCTRVAKQNLLQPCWFTVKIQHCESEKVQPIFSCTGPPACRAYGSERWLRSFYSSHAGLL